MADIRPFHCVHPAPGLESRVAALPYDVYNRKEARIAAGKDPLSFLNIDRPETQFSPDQDIYADAVYAKAGDMLREQIENGVFVQDETSCYYIYELTMEGRSQTGIAACAAIDDYLQGVIKKHENTRAEKEQDRIRHVDACSAQTGPIFLAYRNQPVISDIVRQTKNGDPVYDFVSDDGIRHRGWVIAGEKEKTAIQEAFAGISSIYIADGHHRAASAVKVGLMRRQNTNSVDHHPDDSEIRPESDYFLSVLFPDDELMIMDYNRVVRDLNGLDEADFISQVEKVAGVTKEPDAVRPQGKGEFGMFLAGQWYRCRFKDEVLTSDPVEGLDVSLLQKQILTPVLGIGDPRTDSRIDFVGGIRGLKELERRVQTDCRVAFSMYPTSIQELFDVADAGLLMPPKSTWFEPKLRSGLYIHLI